MYILPSDKTLLIPLTITSKGQNKINIPLKQGEGWGGIERSSLEPCLRDDGDLDLGGLEVRGQDGGQAVDRSLQNQPSKIAFSNTCIITIRHSKVCAK